MSASLVGSEMCIRDRLPRGAFRAAFRADAESVDEARRRAHGGTSRGGKSCLLYTSDAADDM
eukprot:7238931-Alexandrium_andersonii.AAC.1